MGQVQSAFDPDKDKSSNAPGDYVVPPFPSLYNPTLLSTVQQRGFFLHDAYAIWEFTFFWTLILLGATFEACAVLALVNLLYSRYKSFGRRSSGRDGEAETRGRSRRGSSGSASPRASLWSQRKRPPIWLIALIPLVLGAVACCVAIVSGTVVGFALAAVYSAGGFSMSTWVPFMWGMIQVVVLIISSYSSLTRVL